MKSGLSALGFIPSELPRRSADDDDQWVGRATEDAAVDGEGLVARTPRASPPAPISAPLRRRALTRIQIASTTTAVSATAATTSTTPISSGRPASGPIGTATARVYSQRDTTAALPTAPAAAIQARGRASISALQ